MKEEQGFIGDKGAKGTLDSRNCIAAQAHGKIRELKIVWGGWNTESKPGNVRGQGLTHTQSVCMWGLGATVKAVRPWRYLGTLKNVCTGE